MLYNGRHLFTMVNLNVSSPLKRGMVVSALLLMLLLSACNGDPQTRQQTDQGRATLQAAIAHAQSIGVPAAMLSPILAQQAQLQRTSAPLTIFSNQPATDYYHNLAQRYQMLTVQVKGLEAQATQQMDYKANLDLQTFGTLVSQRRTQGFAGAKTFASQLTQQQNLMAQAQYPKSYAQISSSAENAIQALRLMGPAYTQLQSFQQVIQQLNASHLDTTALKQQSNNDTQLFHSATTPQDFSHIIDQVNAQILETSALSTQAIPYVGAAKLSQFSTDIDKLKQYGQATDTYQKRLNADQSALAQAKSLSDFLKVSSQIDSDVASIKLPLLQGQANYLLKQFHQEVATWGNAHQYSDKYNGQSYNLDYEYDAQGIGSDADATVQAAQTASDYQSAIELINDDTLLLHSMETAYTDTTPWNQPHTIDTSLMQHFNDMSGQTIVVSLIQQSLRLYENGQLVKAFQITTGQFDKPSLPGAWNIFLRQSPTKFKSSEPKGSAFWYPDTNINFAMEYHDGGYYFHDSWWRDDYGSGTNFPHYDSGGDESFAGNGSHGCVNMPETMAGWLYNNTAYGAAVVIY
jgi:lipoprotein-anchoring transpeptidase ErfK/SrfK